MSLSPTVPDPPPDAPSNRLHRPSSDLPFFSIMILCGGAYLLLIIAMLVADITFLRLATLGEILRDDEIRYSVRLSLITCTIAALLSLFVAVPLGYLLSRYSFKGKAIIEAILDAPIFLPPLVVGISLLILFSRGGIEQLLNRTLGISVVYEVPAVVIAQFAVAAAFAYRTMRVTFDQIDDRPERVALTLGANSGTAFRTIALPQAWQGIVSAFTLAWSRALGEFGPVLIFAGTTRMKTEVLASSVFLEFSIGEIERALAVSMLLVSLAMTVLIVTRLMTSGHVLMGLVVLWLGILALFAVGMISWAWWAVLALGVMTAITLQVWFRFRNHAETPRERGVLS